MDKGPHHPRKWDARLAGILSLTFLAFLPSLTCGFVNWDDPDTIVNNPFVQSLSPGNIKDMFSSFVLGNYHPLTTLSFALEYKMFGLHPAAVHAGNLILHMFNTALVYFLIRLLTQKDRIAVLTALLFAIHPMRVESVVWASERKDVLFAFFYLGALILYTRYVKESSRNRKLLLWALLLFLLSLFSKPAAISFPLVLLAVDHYVQRPFARNVFLEKVPFFILAVVFGCVAVYGTYTPFESNYPLEYSFSVLDRLVMSGYALSGYVMKLFWPVNLSAFYPYPQKIAGALAQDYYIYAALAAVLVLVIFAFFHRKRWIVFGGILFSVTIVFNLPLLSVGHVVMADRFSYIPYLGLFLIIGYALDTLMERWRTAGRVVITVIAVFLAILTWQRTQVWKSSQRLWSNVIGQFDNVPMAYYNRGDFYFNDNQWALAVRDYTKAVELAPDYFSAYNNRGNSYLLLGHIREAKADYEQALRIRPGHISSMINLGTAYLQSGDVPQALVLFDQVLERSPGHPVALQQKASALKKQGEQPWNPSE